MKLPDIDHAWLQLAQQGDPAALDRLLLTIQPTIFNLAMRMLHQHEDAQDATQEILLRITTHLSSFRGESRFSTWMFRIASNYLLTARSRAKEAPALSLDGLEDKLGLGLQLAERALAAGSPRQFGPDEKLAAQRLALTCTQGMLMCLDREHRAAYVLDLTFGLDSATAADVLEITPEAFRKRLSRARQRLDDFMQQQCGLVNSHAHCTCEKQLAAISEAQRLGIGKSTSRQPEAELIALTGLSNTAAVFRAHPDYQVPHRVIESVRAVLKLHTGGWQ
ncbi:RNA polymerase sigma factor [Aquipseudomonas campi]